MLRARAYLPRTSPVLSFPISPAHECTCSRAAVFSTSTRTSDKPSPSERAAQVIDAAPSSSGLITKTGSIVLGTGLLATAISQEIYVVNEETVIAAGFLVIVGLIGKVCCRPRCRDLGFAEH